MRTNIILGAALFLALFASISACDSILPASFRATPKAGFERMAAFKLQHCVQTNDCTFIKQCFQESRDRCVDAGYAPTCGQMEHEGTCGTKTRSGTVQ